MTFKQLKTIMKQSSMGNTKHNISIDLLIHYVFCWCRGQFRPIRNEYDTEVLTRDIMPKALHTPFVNPEAMDMGLFPWHTYETWTPMQKQNALETGKYMPLATFCEVHEPEQVPIGQGGLHVLQVQDCPRAMVLFSHRPLEVLDQALFDPLNANQKESLLRPKAHQKAKIEQILNDESVKLSHHRKKGSRSRSSSPTRIPLHDQGHPTVKFYNTEDGSGRGYDPGWIAANKEKPECLDVLDVAAEFPPSSLFALTLDDCLRNEKSLQDALVKTTNRVSQDSERRQVPYLNFGPHTWQILL